MGFLSSCAATEKMPWPISAGLVPASSQPAPSPTCSGIVHEIGTRRPIANAVIELVGKKPTLLGFTDDDGRFTFLAPHLGAMQLKTRSPEHLEKRLDVDASQCDEIVIWLERRYDAGKLATVVPFSRSKEIGEERLSADEIKTPPGTYGDVFRAVETLPGVARGAYLGGALSLRGTSPQDSQTFLDGLPLPVLYHYGVGPSVLPDWLIGSIDYTPGAFGARFGHSIGGIVDAHLQQDSSKLSGTFFTDVLATGADLEIPLSTNTGLAFGFRRSYLDLVYQAVVPRGAGTTPTLVPTFTDFQARLSHRSDHLGDFDLIFLGSYDDIATLGGDPDYSNSFTQRKQFYTLRPRWHWQATPQVENTLTLMGTVQDANGAGIEQNTTSGSEVDGALREELTLHPSAALRLSLGLDAAWSGGAFSVSTTAPALSISSTLPIGYFGAPAFGQGSQLVHDYALFAEAELALGRLRLTAGARAELFYYDATVRPSLGPRVAARLELTSQLTLLAAAGYYQKAPALAVLLRPDDTPPGGAPGLEASLQSTLGFEWHLPAGLFLRVTGYFNYLQHLATVPFDLLGQDPLPGFLAVEQQGRVFGMETLLRHKLANHFFGWLSYSLSRSERQGPGAWTLYQNDQTHVLSLVASYELPHGFQLGLRFRLSSGRPYTPAKASLFDATVGAYEPVEGPAMSQRLPLFHQLDLRLDKRIVFQTWQLGLYLDVQNVYDQRNIELAVPSYNYAKQIEFPSLPILPAGGVEAMF